MIQNRVRPLTHGLTALLIGGVTIASAPSAIAAPAVAPANDEIGLNPGVSIRDLWDVSWEWRRTEAIDGGRLQPADPTRYTLDFAPDGTVHVQADCNVGDGAYAIDGAALAVQLSKVSKIRCPDGSHSATYLRDLGDVVFQTADGDDLVLLMRSGGLMRFGRSIDSFLRGAPWLLQQYLASDGRYYGPEEGLDISLRFGNDESVHGSLGCNTFRGRYVNHDNSIDFRNMVASSRLCDDYTMRFERGFRTYITRAAYFWQINNELTFLDENHQPIMVFARDNR